LVSMEVYFETLWMIIYMEKCAGYYIIKRGQGYQLVCKSTCEELFLFNR